MGEQLTFDVSDELEKQEDQPLWLPFALAAMRTAENRWSENTKRAYRYGLFCWQKFCAEFGETETMPPRIESVLAWLDWQSTIQHYAMKTIHLHLAGLSWADRWSRGPHDNSVSLTRHPLVVGWRRGHAVETRAKRRPPAIPPSVDEMRALVVGCLVARKRQGTPRTPQISARDRALFLLVYYGAMRRGELSNLQLRDVVLNGRGIELTWRHSKTDQLGVGEMRAILPQSTAMLCPVEAWQRWLEYRVGCSPESPAFVSVDERGDLTDRALAYSSIDRLLKARCRDAAIRPLSPHQLRAAFATHALQTHEEGEVAYHGRWDARSSMDLYVRRSKTWRKNPTSGLLD